MTTIYENNDLATELRLGLPGTTDESKTELSNNKRSSSDLNHHDQQDSSSTPKVQIVGWPPVRSYRKNIVIQTKNSNCDISQGMYVKVSMDGAPYLRKIDLKMYRCYPELLKALEKMFKLSIGEYSEREGYKGSEFAPAYEDKDGDLMLVGDVPFEMFLSSCKRLRIMKGSEAKGLGCVI